MPPSRDLRWQFETLIDKVLPFARKREDLRGGITLRSPGGPNVIAPTIEEQREQSARWDVFNEAERDFRKELERQVDDLLGMIDWTRILFMAAGIHARNSHKEHDVLGGVCGPCVLAALRAGEEMAGEGYKEASDWKANNRQLQVR